MKKAVFFDFDNTITAFDVIDDMLVRFSKDDRWLDLEKDWKANRIGSRECLDGQVRGLRISKGSLEKYLKKVELDPYFKRLLKLLKERSVPVTILTDNFDMIVKKILKAKRITGLKVYSNKVTRSGERLVPSFPLTNKNHKKGCGHCKKATILDNVHRDMTTVYIGDGLSDVCPSKHADIVFAKGSLTRYLDREKVDYIPITGLKDVYLYFKKMQHGKKGER